MREDYISVIEKWIRAHPGRVLAATAMAMVAMPVGVGIYNLLMVSKAPSLQLVRVSAAQTAPSDGDSYFDVTVAVNNTGTATAEGCYAKAYSHLLFSNEIDEATELGSSEQFDLPPHGGHVATVSVYLPNLSGEALLGGGVRAPVFYRTDCKNAESSDEGRTITVSGLASGSEAALAEISFRERHALGSSLNKD